MRDTHLLRSMLTAAGIATLIGLSACAGSGDSVTANAGSSGGLAQHAGNAPLAQKDPPAPQALPTVNQLRATRGLTETLIQGKFTQLRSAGAVDNGTALDLTAPADGYEWAIYAFDPGANALDSLALLLDAQTGDSVWVGLADYSQSRWEWHGPYSNGRTFAVDDPKYLAPGKPLYCAVVVSNGNSTTIDALSIRTINPQNLAPSAEFSMTGTPTAPTTYSFDASASSDPDGSIIEYAWDWDGDGLFDAISDQPTALHLFNTGGIKDVKLRVTDDQFARMSLIQELALKSAPVAKLSASPPEISAGGSVRFSGLGSADPDGGALDYAWDLDGDGSYETDTAHTNYVFEGYNGAGPLNIRLRVTDSDNNKAYATLPFIVHGWKVTHIFNGMGGFNSVLLEVNGNPAVIAKDNTGNTMRYARSTTALGAAAADWSQVANLGTPADGMYISMAIINGKPAIAYHDGISYDLYYMHSNTVDGALASDWSSGVDVDAVGTIYGYISLKQVDGNPAISYFVDAPDSDLRYVRSSTPLGDTVGDWVPITLDSVGEVGESNSLAIINGNPAVAYYDATNHNLNYIRSNTVDGTLLTDWGPHAVVDTSPNVGYYCSLLEVAGDPAISYWDQGTSHLKYARSVTATGADSLDWSQYVIIDPFTSGGPQSCLAIVDGNPAIGYFDQANANAKYARCSSFDGASATDWTDIETVDGSPLNVGSHSCMALINGRPAVSYHEQSANNELRYAILF